MKRDHGPRGISDLAAPNILRVSCKVTQSFVPDSADNFDCHACGFAVLHKHGP